VGQAASDAAQQVADLVKSMQDQADAAVQAFDAITAYRQAMKDATAQAKKNDAGIQGNSKAALANRDALGNLVAAWNAQDQTVTDNIAKFKEARDNFITTATAMHVPKEAATKLWQEMAKIPASKVVPVSAPGATAATTQVNNLFDAIFRLHDKTVTIRTNQIGGGSVTSSAGGHSTPERRTPRLSERGLSVRTPSMRELDGSKAAYADQVLGLLAKNSDDAAKGAKGLKEQLAEAEKHLKKMTRAADAAHAALDSLRSQKADLAAGVTGSLAHDPFKGGLSDFNTQIAADTADAQAVLAALQTLVSNGLDPHSDLFKRLAASGNVGLIQEFAALTRDQLAGEAASFIAGQSALAAPGAFAGGAAFNDVIKAQEKTTNHLDDTVHHLAQQVNQLQHAIDHLGDNVERGVARSARWVAAAVEHGARNGTEKGTRAGFEEKRRRLAAMVRTGGRIGPPLPRR
jgi:phage shock protein A